MLSRHPSSLAWRKDPIRVESWRSPLPWRPSRILRLHVATGPAIQKGVPLGSLWIWGRMRKPWSVMHSPARRARLLLDQPSRSELYFSLSLSLPLPLFLYIFPYISFFQSPIISPADRYLFNVSSYRYRFPVTAYRRTQQSREWWARLTTTSQC